MANIIDRLSFVAASQLVDRSTDINALRDYFRRLISAQKATLLASKNGDVYLTRHEISRKGRTVVVHKTIRPWWYRMGGKYYVQPQIGPRVIQFKNDTSLIEAGLGLEDVEKVLDTLMEALGAGELDNVIRNLPSSNSIFE